MQIQVSHIDVEWMPKLLEFTMLLLLNADDVISISFYMQYMLYAVAVAVCCYCWVNGCIDHHLFYCFLFEHNITYVCQCVAAIFTYFFFRSSRYSLFIVRLISILNTSADLILFFSLPVLTGKFDIWSTV